MPDFRVVDTADEHPKMRSAGPAAIGLWTMAGARAMRDGTDGWIPQHYVLTWPNGKRHASTLVKVGLWRSEERRGVPGYRFHDFLQFQRSSRQIETDRAKARDRAASRRVSGRSSGEHSPNGRRDSGGTSTVTDPEPTTGVPAEFGGAPYPLPPEGVGGEGSSGRQRAGTATIPPEEPFDQEERQPCGRRHSSAEPCGGCAAARRMTADHDRQAEAARRAKQSTVRDCRMCDADERLLEVGRFMPVSPSTTCDHETDHRQQVADARDEPS